MPGEAETAAAQLRKQLAEHEAAAAAAGAANSEAQSQLAAWQGKSAELATARASLQQLEDRMFVGPAWRASPRLSELGDSLRALEAQAAEVGKGGKAGHACDAGCGPMLQKCRRHRWRLAAGGRARGWRVLVRPFTSSLRLGVYRHNRLSLFPASRPAWHAICSLTFQAGRHAQSFGRGTQLLQGAVRGLQEALQARGGKCWHWEGALGAFSVVSVRQTVVCKTVDSKQCRLESGVVRTSVPGCGLVSAWALAEDAVLAGQAPFTSNSSVDPPFSTSPCARPCPGPR